MGYTVLWTIRTLALSRMRAVPLARPSFVAWAVLLAHSTDGPAASCSSRTKGAMAQQFRCASSGRCQQLWQCWRFRQH